MEGALGRAAEYLYILPPWPSSHPLLTLDLSQLGISGELGPVPGQFHCRKFHILVYLLLQFPCPSEMWDALCLTPASCIHSTQPSSTTLCSSLLLPLCICWKPKLPEKDLQCLSTAPGQNQGEQNQNMTLVYHSTRQLCPLTQSWERPLWAGARVPHFQKSTFCLTHVWMRWILIIHAHFMIDLMSTNSASRLWLWMLI